MKERDHAKRFPCLSVRMKVLLHYEAMLNIDQSFCCTLLQLLANALLGSIRLSNASGCCVLSCHFAQLWLVGVMLCEL